MRTSVTIRVRHHVYDERLDLFEVNLISMRDRSRSEVQSLIGDVGPRSNITQTAMSTFPRNLGSDAPKKAAGRGLCLKKGALELWNVGFPSGKHGF